MPSSLANRFRTFCQTTSCHGFPQLANSEQLLSKIFWSLVLLFFSGLLLYNTGSVVATFFDDGSRWGTSISESYSSNLAHPTVTICNYNKFRKSVVKQLDIPESMLIYLLLRNPAAHYFSSSKTSDIIEEVIEDWNRWRLYNVTTRELHVMTSHQCEDMIKLMRLTLYESRQETIPNPCNLSMENDSIQAYTIRPLDVLHDCTQFQFNMETEAIRMSTMGQAKGTTHLLDVEPDEYMEIADANPPDVGFMLQLSDGERIEFGKWINLSPGSHNWVGMRRLEHRAGDAFDSFFKPPCIKNPKMKFMYDSFYSKELCYFDCSFIPFVETCNCHVAETPTYKMCEENQMYDCEQELLKIGNSLEMKRKVSECIQTCEAPCESKTILTSSTSSHFPSPAQLPALQKSHPHIFGNMTFQEIKRRYIMVDIYYASAYVTVIEWHMRNRSLISNLGGLMGLFLGISVITLIHGILHFCVDPIKQQWDKLNASQQVKKH